MTTLPATTSSFSTLYPLKRDDSIIALVQDVLTFEKQDGKPVLHRKLTIEEREILNRRAQELGEHLKPAHHQRIRALVSQMLAGFNKGASAEDAKAIVSQYIVVLQHLPAWAIERACGKFSRGESIDGIDGVERSIVQTRGPTTAQLYQVARKIAEEWYGELHNVRNALNGFVPRIISEEERERVRQKLEEFADTLRADTERAAHEARRPGDPWSPPTDEQVRESLKRMGDGMAKQDQETAQYE